MKHPGAPVGVLLALSLYVGAWVGSQQVEVVREEVPVNHRTGAICRDGWQSSATGQGACSWHGGVARWTYTREEIRVERRTFLAEHSRKFRNLGHLSLAMAGILWLRSGSTGVSSPSHSGLPRPRRVPRGVAPPCSASPCDDRRRRSGRVRPLPDRRRPAEPEQLDLFGP